MPKSVAAFAYFFTLQTNQALASDIWTKADTILKDIYGKILGISTIAAIVTASVALLLMNFSKSGKTGGRIPCMAQAHCDLIGGFKRA